MKSLNNFMIKYLAIIILVIIMSAPALVFAQSINCSMIDGAYIYSYQGYSYSGDNWKFIGSIDNKFNADSIANQFSVYGSQFSVDSINDTFGSFGSQFSAESAFNDYASNPPILVTPNGSWGYLTTNQYRYPHVSPYFALACAEQSY